MTASYLQNNDYTPLQLRKPYQLPVNDIAQTVVALDSYWKQGAARVKAQYENVAGLNLTLKSNQDYAQSFLKQAQDQMKKLSTKDLSSRDVQMEGINLFKPILENNNIKLDHTISNLRQSVIAEAQSYKTKGKGEGYHDDNVKVALDAFKGFGADTDPNNLASIYEKAKNARYTPYYDASKERMNILKECRDTIGESTYTDGDYIVTSESGMSKEKLYGCLEGAYSENARQQFRISGMARYDGNYEALRQDYVEDAKERKKYYETSNAQLIADIAAKKKLGQDYSKEEQILKMQQEGVENLNKDLETYNSWTLKDIEDRYEGLSYMAYFKRSNESFAEAFAQEKRIKDIAVNPLSVAEYNHNRIDARQEREYALEQQADLNSLKTGVGKDGSKLEPIDALKRISNLYEQGLITPETFAELNNMYMLATEGEKTTAQQLQTKIGELRTKEFEMREEIVKSVFADSDGQKILKSLIPNFNPNRPLNITAEQNKQLWRILLPYSQKLLSDKDASNDTLANKIKDAYNALLANGNERNTWQTVLRNAENQAKKDNGDIFENYEKQKTQTLSELNKNYNNVKLNNGAIINSNTLVNIFSDNDPNYKITKDVSLQGDVPSYSIYDRNNKKVLEIVKGYNPFYSNLFDIYEKFEKNKNNKNSNFQQKINEIVSQNTLVQKMGIALGNVTESKIVQTDLQTIFGELGPELKYTTLGMIDPVTGRVAIKVFEKDGTEIPYSRLRDAIAVSKVAGVDAKQYKGAGGKETEGIEITLPSVAGIIKKPEYSDQIRSLINSTLGMNNSNLTRKDWPSSGVKVDVGINNKGQHIGIKIDKQIGTNKPIYRLIINGIAMGNNMNDTQIEAVIQTLSDNLKPAE